MLADLLVSQLSRPATTKERFRLPFSKTDTVRVFLAGVKAEVERRDKTFVMSDALLTQTEQIAEWLTGDHSKFGLMLCGGCGNGKTTFVKAFQQILNKFEIKVDDDYSERYSIRIVNARDLAGFAKRTMTNGAVSVINGCLPLTISALSRLRLWITAMFSIRYLSC